MRTLERDLAAVAAMSSDQLREEWRRLMKAPPPALSPDLMRLALSYQIQVRRLGGLSLALQRELSPATTKAKRAKLRPGMRLVRSWNGKTIDVIVTDRGFEFQGRNYRSLSHVAREVTGTVWSGPRFFGLNANG